MEVWEAPGAPETLQKGGGEAPRPNEIATEAPGAAQTPKMTDLRSLNYAGETLTRSRGTRTSHLV